MVPSTGKYMFDDSGENIAARETMQTICSLRDREKTWYGGERGLWLSRLTEDEKGVGNCLLS